MPRTLDKEIHFMDISKDISLVNSDNESVVNTNDNESDHLNQLLAETQSELNLKNKNLIELEANIFAQQQKISMLEDLNKNLQEEVTTFKEKLSLMDNENSVLKSTIDTLNSTIKELKDNLETATNNIDSYNSLIQELQIKINQKEKLPIINIDDSTLENMIANEEEFIANNENMRNIIYSLKIALDKQNKEIDNLRTSAQLNNDVTHEKVTLTEQLESKTKEVNSLNKKINENVTSINKLVHEKNVLTTVEQELSEKLANYEQINSDLEKMKTEISTSAERLKEENDKLKLSITEKDLLEQEMSEINIQLLKQVENLTAKIAALETEISGKDDLISSLEKADKKSKDYLLNAKAAVLKSQLILNTLSGNMQEMPEVIDNFVNVFNVLSNTMDTLENVANNVIKQKEEISKNNDDLKRVIEELTLKHKSEITAIQKQLEVLITNDSTSQENLTLTQTTNRVKNDLEITRNELHKKISENENLEASLKQATENIETCNQKIAELLHRQISLEELTTRLEENERILQENISELMVNKEQITNSIQERDELLNNVYKNVTEFTIKYNIQNDINGELHNDSTNINERILLTLDKIGSHISFITSKNDDDDNKNIKLNEKLLEAKQETVELAQQNVGLLERLSQAESKHSELSSKLVKIQDDNEELKRELSLSQQILDSLQVELKMKADELTSMEDSIRDWKEQFMSQDIIMKQQMEALKLENEQLKAITTDVQHKPESNSIITYEHKDTYNIGNQTVADIKQISDSNTCGDLSSPPSLLTICCNKIVDSIQPKEIDSNTTTTSNEFSDNIEQNYIVECRCNELKSELEAIRKENFEITELLEHMKAVNQYLIEEQEEARHEIQQLLAPVHELQKKIINHKTNLSILTATTTAENRALKSQVKGLQHHHSRFHNVCQRDIPDFKKQLRELMTLLRGDPSIADQQNVSFKRYSLPDVLDSSTALSTLKNDSTLDGDLLMLDTNITMTSGADNTLTAHDQTCLDLTQYYNEAACQTNELNQIEILSHDMNMYERLNILKDENVKLRELVNKYAEMKQSMIDAQISPIKINNVGLENIKQVPKSNDISVPLECDKCNKLTELQLAQEELNHELKSLSQELLDVKSQKAEIEEKYNNLMLETPSTDLLVKKFNILEKDYDIKNQEIAKLKHSLSNKVEELKRLQDENDSLSTQVIESISEADELNKELDSIKNINKELLDKCSKLQQSVKELSDLSNSCSECLSKDELIKTMELRLTKSHTKLNRSLSDSDSSSRHNKICTLQSELDAGREDCKEITEDVTTIKNHLDRSNLSMDFDDSMGESDMYAFTKNYAVNSPQSKKCIMPDIPEEHPIDVYKMDKIDCLNYYAEKTGVGNENINRDIKIIDLMKTFYGHLITKHGNEIENLTNKLKVYDETKSQLEKEISYLKEAHSQVTVKLEQKDKNYTPVVNALSQIKNNINSLNEKITSFTDIDVTKLINMYKDYFFKVLDSELGLSSMQMIETLFNNILNKHTTDLTGIMEENTKLLALLESVFKELNSVKENLEHLKCQLSAKDEEYNLLKKQKERIQAISNAVTLDIVNRDNELTETISNIYKKLINLNIINNEDIDLTLSANANINLLFEHVITQHKNSIGPDLEKEKENLVLELNNTKQIIEETQKEIRELQSRSQKLQEINDAVTVDLVDKENKLQAQSVLYRDLNEIYESKVKENKANVDLVTKLSEEVKLLKYTVVEKEKTIEKLELEIDTQSECKIKEITELIQNIKVLEDNIARLKEINEVIAKEKESYSNELLKSGETIKQNNIEMDKMTSDILVLRESVRENGIVIENLTVEVKNLMKQNMELKEKFEDKCKEYSRLETNIKTHEKTAEIQSRMIMRLVYKTLFSWSTSELKLLHVQTKAHQAITI